MLKIENFKVLDDLSKKDLYRLVLKRMKIDSDDVVSFRIKKKAIDARNKENIFYNYAFWIDVKDEDKYPNLARENDVQEEILIKRDSEYRPIIVGAGPAGLFCALKLVDNGFKPIIIEQGKSVDERVLDIEKFKSERILNPRSNVLFGEGGAGTFSDGKLTTGVSSPYIKDVLEYFYKFGAPEEILYEAKPHIGTDILRDVLKNMRKYIEFKGGEYFFETKMTDILKNEDGEITVICEDEEFVTDSLVLAIGHSAVDTYKLLKDRDVKMAKKNFAVGVRIEHKQKMIDISQYGNKCKLNLPPASYKMVYHGAKRSCFTFCMCPGGEVVLSSDKEGRVITNGMSYYKRDLENANAALLVNVLTTDLEGDDPLAGVYFQEKLEKDAYRLGGSNYNAPVQRVEDFLNNRPSSFIGSVKPSVKPGYTLTNLNEILPDFVSETLKEGIISFGKKIKGFDEADAILTGVETRSSAPLTILRDESLESSIKRIYPCGEGAGYAGGITTSAIDGIKVAIKIMEKGN